MSLISGATEMGKRMECVGFLNVWGRGGCASLGPDVKPSRETGQSFFGQKQMKQEPAIGSYDSIVNCASVGHLQGKLHKSSVFSPSSSHAYAAHQNLS